MNVELIKRTRKYGAGCAIHLSSESNEINKRTIKDRLVARANSYDFNNLTDERRNQIIEEGIELKKKFIDNDTKIGSKYYDIVAYIIVLNDKKREIDYSKYSSEEVLALLIETIDPKLLLLKIYLTSNTDFEIEKKANRLFGFYDPNLIDFEREYARRFYKKNRNEKTKKLEQ